MSAPDPVWFGSRSRPLAGYVHRPAGAVSGGVLICAPFGYEAVCAHRSLRRLADLLAADGLIALRFDYEGAGQSSGTGHEEDLLSRWQDDVASGIAELRRLGVTRPALAGLRLGASLALAAAAHDREVGPIALWSPLTSGARYYRELRGHAAVTSGGVLSDGSLNVTGHLVSPSFASELRAFRPLTDVPPELELLLIDSPGFRDYGRAAADLRDAGLEPSVIDMPGTAEVIEEDAELVAIPEALLNRMSRWIAQRSSRAPVEHDTDDSQFGPVVEFDGGAGVIREEIVRIHGLHGVWTEPPSTRDGRGVIFLNNGAAGAEGPGRAWVQFARTLAAGGVSSLRFDQSGLGESPNPKGRLTRRPKVVARTTGPEILNAVSWMRDRGVGNITVVGLCSGAQVAVRLFAFDGQVENIVSINPPLFSLRDIGVGPIVRLLWDYLTYPMRKDKARRVLHHIPAWLWKGLDALWIYPLPARFLRRVADRGIRLHLVFGDHDKGIVDIQCRGSDGVERLVSEHRIGLEIVEDMDHSMFNHSSRSRVLATLHRSLEAAQLAAPQFAIDDVSERIAGCRPISTT